MRRLPASSPDPKLRGRIKKESQRWNHALGRKFGTFLLQRPIHFVANTSHPFCDDAKNRAAGFLFLNAVIFRSIEETFSLTAIKKGTSRQRTSRNCQKYRNSFNQELRKSRPMREPRNSQSGAKRFRSVRAYEAGGSPSMAKSDFKSPRSANGVWGIFAPVGVYPQSLWG